MKNKDSKKANNPASDEQTCKKSTYTCVGVEEEKNWKKRASELITVIELNKYRKATECIEVMKSCIIRPYTPSCWPTILHNAENRVKRLIDPLNNDQTFRELLGIKTYAECLSKEQLNKLEDLWRLQDCLLFRLRVSEFDYGNTDDKRKVAHYCRAEALPGILKDGLKLCSLSSTNDPTEGKQFAKFLRSAVDVECFKDRIESMLAMQCSFSNRINDLNQFRLYGRDSVIGGEGTGLCLVFNMGYFDNRHAVPVATINAGRRHQAKVAKENENNLIQYGFESDDAGSQIPLYWVLYYDDKMKRFYHTTCQRERTFCTNSSETKEGNAASIYRDERRNQQGIMALLQRIEKVFVDLDRMNKKKLGWDLCVYLRHLIKHAAFRDEREMRILKLCPFGDADVQPLNENGPLSCCYNPIFAPKCNCPLVKIIAGPKLKNFMVFRDRIRHILAAQGALEDVEVVQSDVPLA